VTCLICGSSSSFAQNIFPAAIAWSWPARWGLAASNSVEDIGEGREKRAWNAP